MRFMLIHSKTPTIEYRDDDVKAHCFGPFDSFEEAAAFHVEADDDCYSWALPIMGPHAIDIIEGDIALRFWKATGKTPPDFRQPDDA
jgi:hypothetical protein